MKEDFLHFIWEHALFNARVLHTTEGEDIFIIRRGDHNLSSGPDFSQARIKIGDTLWIGAVEIHLKSSDWLHHGHQHDPAYDGVILHVVYEDDTAIHCHNGSRPPTFELKGLIPAHIVRGYERLRISKSLIPCADSIDAVKPIDRQAWLDRMLVERLERKANDIRLVHNYSDRNWKQCFYAVLAANLGQNRNKLPMLELARKLPFTLVRKHMSDATDREALYLGMAGLLPANSKGGYHGELLARFRFLKKNMTCCRSPRCGRPAPSDRIIHRHAGLHSFLQWSSTWKKLIATSSRACLFAGRKSGFPSTLIGIDIIRSTRHQEKPSAPN